MDTRLYVVTPNLDKLPETAKPRVIKAGSAAAAIKFATKDFYTVNVADASEAIALGNDGVKVETA